MTSTNASRDKLVSAADAVRLIRDGDVLVVDGFMGQCYAEELVLALEERFTETSSPRDLGLVCPVLVGDKKGRGIDHLAHPGLVRSLVAGHLGMAPALGKLAVDGDIEAHNLPQGVIAHLLRDTAAGKPGLLSRVGLGTFVDPRNGGGKVNDRTETERVRLLEVADEEFLFYPALKLDVALLRGTTGDPDGNITMEHEGLTLEALAAATAVHNSGGLVIVQVERIAERGTLDPRMVKLPGILVDCVVQATDPAHTHMQTIGTAYSPAYSGEVRMPLTGTGRLDLDPRKVIARRAALELRLGSVVNLGLGMPEGVAAVANEENVLRHLTLTAEPGVIGGLPQSGFDFGCAANPQAILDQPAQFDFYDGGGLDAAFLGMAEVDARGNVNVSRFGPKLAGAGGFINISQNAKQLVFVGTFAARSEVTISDGELSIDDSSALPKFVEEVEQITFSGEYAAARGQSVLYVTERCVFRLTDAGLALVEVAPGVDIQRDILDQLPFEPVIKDEPAVMDARLFATEAMGLDADLLEIPVASRFAFDENRNMFFLNLEGLTLATRDDVDAIHAAVRERLEEVGHPVQMVINYDNFFVAPEVNERYLAAVESLAEEFYESATRYTTSSFLRLKLSEGLSRRGMAPHVYESRTEATAWNERDLG